jgi:hypothetical protein
MNWEQRYCQDPLCTHQAWMVQPDPTTQDVWWVAGHADDRPFTVAATVPICPRCGSTLGIMLELEDERERHLASLGGIPAMSLAAA